MLGTRTKQVFSYGRRGHRIVNVSDDRDSRKMKVHTTISVASALSPDTENLTENIVISSLKPPRPIHRKKAKISSPLTSPPQRTKLYRKKLPDEKTRKTPKLSKGEIVPSVRHPLGLFPSNVPGSPAIAPPLRKKKKPILGKGTPLKPSSPIVNVEIVVLDHAGRRVSQERRISRTDIQVNPTHVSPADTIRNSRNAGKSKSDAIILSDSEDDAPLLRKAAARPSRRIKSIIISSDDDDEDDPVERKLSALSKQSLTPDLPKPPRKRPGIKHRNIIMTPPSSPEVVQTQRLSQSTRQPLAAQLRPASSEPHFAHSRNESSSTTLLEEYRVAAPRTKPRQLTPIRARPGRSIFPAPPSLPSPTTPSDFDYSLDLDFQQLALSPTTIQEVGEGLIALEQAIPEYLLPLLHECSQTTPHEFSAFIEMFPFDQITQTPHGGVGIRDSRGQPRFQKIGEASYSEVFGIGDVVLKVIPLRDEEAAPRFVEDDMESPAPSDAKDVLKEVIVTGAMGEACGGFVKLLRTYVVRGKYPSLLLDLWDEYYERKGSESVRPDSFSVSQVYAIIVLPNGGPDLEAYSFASSTKSGWKQACSLFWQVTRALAEAEDLVRFEHRDLHWGQILVKNTNSTSKPRRSQGKRVPMDHEAHGVKATVIDLGLARMDANASDRDEVRWTPFEEEVFEGEGDYQFDVYRMMREHHGNSWEGYRPLTNVMWLHYLSLKLLHSKRLRPPPSTSRKSTVTAPSTFSERECHQCLVEVEEMLANVVASSKPPPPAKKGRRKTQAPVKALSPSEVIVAKSASDVLRLAIEKGWVRS